jgi:hypothetical protein
VRELRTVPTVAGLDALVGAPVGAGFRGRLAAAAPGLESGSSLLHLLLDDLPGASLVGGYALLHADALPVTDGPAPPPKVDICAGWAEGSTMISTIRLTGRTPTPIGPPAPSLDRPGDPLAWTPLTDPGPHGTRRVRRIDLLAAGPDGLRPVDVFFRDTHWDGDGVETVVHEYSLAVVVDPLAGTVTGVRATPDVLPWMECPSAIASAGRIVGRALVDLRGLVRREFSGTSTCTHLNDTLRSLGDVEDLLRIAPV